MVRQELESAPASGYLWLSESRDSYVPSTAMNVNCSCHVGPLSVACRTSVWSLRGFQTIASIRITWRSS